MNNVVKFPIHAPLLHEGRESDAKAARDEACLLSALTDLRDQLACANGPLDAEARQRCVAATDAALAAAMGLEHALLKQTLYIEDITRVARTDPLTGVHNRRGFEHEFQRALATATRYGETGVLIYIDLDSFKPINDTYGHAAGDLVLIEVARVLSQGVRPHDLVARLGGDEFAVLLTRTDWENGLKRAEALKHRLNTTYVRWNAKNIAVRASLGFQRFGPDADPHKLLDQADRAMFEAKRLRGTARPDDR